MGQPLNLTSALGRFERFPKGRLSTSQRRPSVLATMMNSSSFPPHLSVSVALDSTGFTLHFRDSYYTQASAHLLAKLIARIYIPTSLMQIWAAHFWLPNSLHATPMIPHKCHAH